jgi:predicted CopG family antitoxin
MPTTIQVKKDTRRLLEKLKRQMGVSSYDEVIRRLVRRRAGVPSSLFGSCRGSMPCVREKEEEHVSQGFTLSKP